MRLAGYGLEDAYAEQPDIGVIRRHRTVSDQSNINRGGSGRPGRRGQGPLRVQNRKSSLCGSVPNKTDLESFCDIITERLKRLYDVGARTEG